MENKNCNKTSDNKYFDCPAIMNDGRAFTDYRPSSTVDDMIRLGNNVRSNYEYRQFLINNASAIMNINNKYLDNKLGCHGHNPQMMPFDQSCVYNNDYGVCSPHNFKGVGLKNNATKDSGRLM